MTVDGVMKEIDRLIYAEKCVSWEVGRGEGPTSEQRAHVESAQAHVDRVINALVNEVALLKDNLESEIDALCNLQKRYNALRERLAELT
jgi:hypothetical protein